MKLKTGTLTHLQEFADWLTEFAEVHKKRADVVEDVSVSFQKTRDRVKTLEDTSNRVTKRLQSFHGQG